MTGLEQFFSVVAVAIAVMAVGCSWADAWGKRGGGSDAERGGRRIDV